MSPRNRVRPQLLAFEQRITPALNDNFADAYNLIGQFDSHFWGNYEFDPVTQDLIEYTGEVGEPNHAGASEPLQSAWYRWTAPISAPTTIDVLDFSFAETVTIAVYTGSAVNALTEVTSVSGSPGADAKFNAVAGTEYSIAIDNVGSALFDFELVLSSFPTPVNDNFADAVVLDSSPVPAAVATGTSTGSTFETDEPNHGEGLEYFGFPLTFQDSTWFSWTAPTTGSVQIKMETDIDFGNTFIAGVSVGLAVYTGSAVDDLTLTANSFGIAGGLAVNDDFLFSGAEASFNSVAGTIYHIAASGNRLFPETFSLKLLNHAVPGSIAIDDTVYVVGTTGVDNISITPAGSATDGSTGVKVKGNYGGTTATTTHVGSIKALETYASNGDNVVTVSDAIRLPTVADFGPGHDRYQGGNGYTIVYAGEGNNIIRTGASFDDIYAGNGNDDIRTGAGIDFIRPGDGNNTVISGPGDDNVFLLPTIQFDVPFTGHNYFDLGSGDDLLWIVSDGPTQVRAGAGSDDVNLSGNSNSNIFGGDGDDSLQVGVGNNVVDAGAGNDLVTAGSFFALGNGANVIQAGSGNDVVHVSSNGPSVVVGGDGDDEVAIGFKPSFFPGPVGSGSGIVFGGAGADILLGGPAGDLLSGDAGNDLIAGGLGSDVVVGGSGSDILFDGTAATKGPDSLRQVLADWDPTSLASYIDVRSRLTVTFDTASRDYLFGGSGQDWFWSDDPLDVLDRLPGESRN